MQTRTRTPAAQIPNALQAVYLERIAAAAGRYEGHRIDGNLRNVLQRRGWITATTHDGSPAGPREWAAHLRITDEGSEAARAVLARPAELTDRPAGALLKIEQRGADGYEGFWPGDGFTRSVCERFGLVVAAGQHHTDWARNTWRLTDAGREALDRWRAKPRKPAIPTAAQAKLLAGLIEGSQRRGYESGTYDACERNGWTAWGPVADEHGRRPLFITAAGREAHQRALTAAVKPAKAKPVRVAAGKLTGGMTVRLANRGGYRNLGPEWVTVHHVVKIAAHGGQPGGYQVWVTDAQPAKGKPEPWLYAGTTFHGIKRFEIKS